MRTILWLSFVALIGACAPTPGEDGASAVIPILANDPDDLVETMEWGTSPPIIFPQPEDATVLVLMESSTPEVARIAVEGGGCPPTTQVQVSGTPESVAIELVLGGSIEPAGIECTESPTTHELIIRFNQPIDLDEIQISVRRTEGG